MNRSEFRFFDHLRVRWAEVDMQKIVFNGHYLLYFDTAVAAYWRALAMTYHDTMESLDGDIYLRKVTLEYEASARYEDLCDVGMRCARIGKSSMSFVAALFRGPQLLVHGELLYVFADPATQTSKPVPTSLREVLLGYEAGEAMSRTEVRQGDWPGIADDVLRLRQRVFGDELAWPAAAGADADDAGATHVLVRNRFDQVVAAGRLVVAGEAGAARVGRIVVNQSVRGGGLGRQVLNGVLAAADRAGLRDLRLDAPPHLLPFYGAAGFVPEGDRFTVDGVEHQSLRRVA
jgi:YbgC/YbaW family acyl-CoA thioester hydrolase